MQINFCDTSKFGFSLYYIGNQFFIKFYSFYDSPYINEPMAG